VSSITPEAEAAAWSFWTIDYWLRHCEEYRVWDASGPLGYVEAVLMNEDDEPHSLVVRVGSVSGELVTWPVEAVESLDAATERVFVTSTAELPRGGPVAEVPFA
jgi:hypothetical protein